MSVWVCVPSSQIEELEKKLVDRTQEVERLRSELVSETWPVLTLEAWELKVED